MKSSNFKCQKQNEKIRQKLNQIRTIVFLFLKRVHIRIVKTKLTVHFDEFGHNILATLSRCHFQQVISLTIAITVDCLCITVMK